ncbi:GntR family transcriptional regulator [Thalassovita sp.]|uniref:GntR family transcriptional regulator n=1 Tax=Thalassovita sp. TaxID=1979401 RepID=UPI002882C53A|nr:GntR family transcriptional regulator [Thalassovita sp.]MDF1804087.1 GntR family transcriptional regulator [Thalassovita sp.]
MPQQTLSSPDALVRDIVRGLYEGAFLPGQRLIEPELMAKYCVSRSTVREAIKKLAAQGIAETHLNRGARIRQLTRADAMNILLIIEPLIGLAARQAALSIHLPGNAEQFNTVLEPFLSPPAELDTFDFARQRNRFHRTMARIGGNTELETILSNMNVHMFGHKLEITPEQRLQAYGRIGAAVLAGDPVTADAEARAYVRRSMDLLDDVFPED